MKKFLDFLQSNFTGRRTILWNKINVPKLARLAWLAFIITALGDTFKILPITILGYVLLSLFVFCFFMLRLLPRRQFNGLTRQ